MKPDNLRRHVRQIGLDVAEENLRRRHKLVIRAGHSVHPDLVVAGCLLVKIRASLWVAHAHGAGRYQFSTRQKADLYVLVCVSTGGHAFVIPGHIIGDRTSIAIWSRDPTEYTGRWKPYLNRWSCVQEILDRCQKPPDSSSPGRTPT